MTNRVSWWVTAVAILLVVIAAGLLNSGGAGLRGLRYVAYLGQWEIFHVVAHLIIFAGVFDLLDGCVARMTNRFSEFGVQLDSIWHADHT